MELRNVKIGPSYFAKELREYSDWTWALIREAAQNGMDARGCDNLEFIVCSVGGDTQLTFQNNGEPMTESIMVNKLLALGESGKEFNGTAGGFGKAKLLLYMSHESYNIRTGTLEVQGSGGNYTLQRDLPYYHGTRSTITISGDQVEKFNSKVKRFAMLAQWNGTLVLNGETLETHFRKGHHRRDFSWCNIHTNQQYNGLLVVRINGQPMFTRSIAWKGCVVVELTGNSSQRLVASRDRLTYTCQNELDDFITNLTVDTKSALRQQIAEYKRYEGDKLRAEKKKPKAVENFNVAAFVATVTQPHSLPGSLPHMQYGGIHSTAVSRTMNRTSQLGPEFILKSTTGMAVPEYYIPGDKFSAYAKGLVKAWACSIKRLYELMDLESEFSVGFILDEESKAECEQSSEYGLVYYLNPANVVKNERFNSRSYKACFSSAWTNRFEILSLVAHEFVHGAYDLSAHNEDFSSAMTKVLEVMMQNLKDFVPYFR